MSHEPRHSALPGRLVCFIQALKGLSHPTTSRRGNTFGMVGMAIAAVDHRGADL